MSGARAASVFSALGGCVENLLKRSEEPKGNTNATHGKQTEANEKGRHSQRTNERKAGVTELNKAKEKGNSKNGRQEERETNDKKKKMINEPYSAIGGQKSIAKICAELLGCATEDLASIMREAIEDRTEMYEMIASCSRPLPDMKDYQHYCEINKIAASDRDSWSRFRNALRTEANRLKAAQRKVETSTKANGPYTIEIEKFMRIETMRWLELKEKASARGRAKAVYVEGQVKQNTHVTIPGVKRAIGIKATSASVGKALEENRLFVLMKNNEGKWGAIVPANWGKNGDRER